MLKCDECEAGKYAVEGSFRCLECPAGRYGTFIDEDKNGFILPVAKSRYNREILLF